MCYGNVYSLPVNRIMRCRHYRYSSVLLYELDLFSLIFQLNICFYEQFEAT